MSDDGEPVRSDDAAARVPWLVVFLSAGGAQLLPGQRLLLQDLPADEGPVEVALATRYEDAGLTDLVPHELVLEVHVHAPDADAAVAAGGAVAGGLVAMVSLAVNAHVPPPEPHLAYESAPGLSRRRFWQRDLPLQTGLPVPGRMLTDTVLFPLLQAIFASSETQRLARAVSQYHVALRYWTTAGRPLALAHLYMALEALGPAAERAERARLGLADERAHAVHRGVDVTRSNWKEVLLGWVRRDVLCRGDKATYDAARKASDGLEHGSMGLSEYRAAAEQHGRALLDYVRGAVLDLLDLPASVRVELAAKRPLDVSPLWQEVRGELHGAVQDPAALGLGHAPYPYGAWRTTLDDVWRLPDGRLRAKPRINLTAELADGVQLTVTGIGTGVGLSDADLFDFQPSDEEPMVIRAGDRAGPTADQPAQPDRPSRRDQS